MAKKKSEKSNLKNIFVLRGSDEFKLWMDELAEVVGSPLTVLVERALRELAKRHGHRNPPRRIK